MRVCLLSSWLVVSASDAGSRHHFRNNNRGGQRQSQGKRQAYMQHCSCVSCRGRHTPATHLLRILQCRIIVLQAGLRMYTCVCMCVWAWEAMGWLAVAVPASSSFSSHCAHAWGSTTHAHHLHAIMSHTYTHSPAMQTCSTRAHGCGGPKQSPRRRRRPRPGTGHSESGHCPWPASKQHSISVCGPTAVRP